MAIQLVASLLDGTVLQTNPLATVMADCVVIRDSARTSHIIIGLARLSGMRQVRTTHPELLVISAGLLLISAAAYYSKDGAGAGLPIGLLGLAFALGYLLSRRASISFLAGRDSTETVSGSLSEAAALVAAVRNAQVNLLTPDLS